VEKRTPTQDAGFELPANMEWVNEPYAMALYRAWCAASEAHARQVAVQSAIEDRVFALQREREGSAPGGGDSSVAVLAFPKAAAETAGLNAELSEAEARTDDLVRVETSAFNALMAYQPVSLYGVALKILAIGSRDDEEMAARAAADLRRLLTASAAT
jgi:hypothetical protein